MDGIGYAIATPTHHQEDIEFANLGIQNSKLFGEGSQIYYFKGGEGLINEFRASRYNNF